MGVKDIQIKPLPAGKANDFIKRHHYSGKVVSNSQLHLGAYYHGRLGGVLQFGPPIVRDHLIDLVDGTGWNEMLELNRMAFTDDLPEHSGSRILGITFRLFKKHAPHVKWVVSFADATRCGDGAVYRASNFVLTQIKTNKAILQMPSGETIAYPSLSSHPNTPRPELGGKTFLEASDGSGHISVFMRETGAEWLEGYQLRYIYFIDKSYRERLAVAEIPFSEIDRIGAGMYKGEKVSVAERQEQARR